ncbi:MAG: hypothetical protein ACI935_003500 [Moritella dasanensis]|jgi:hypothetical protein
MWQQIVDLPVIVQGALGSALFGLTFEFLKRLINLVVEQLAKVNSTTRNELQVYDAMYHGRCSGTHGISMDVKSVFMALRRLLYAMIYVCFGLIASQWLGTVASLAYMIALFHLFVALRAMKITFGSDLSKDEHKAICNEIMQAVRDRNT